MSIGVDVFTFEAINILIILLPGLLTSIIVNSLIVRRQASDLRLVIESLVYTFVITTSYALIKGDSPVNIQKDNLTVTYDGWSFLILLGIAITLALIISASITHDWHMWLMRKINVSYNTARLSVWLDALYDHNSYVIVHFMNGSRLYGWPEYFSDSDQGTYLYLVDVRWIDPKTDEYREPEIDGILITPAMEIEYIYFLPDLEKEKN